MRVFCYKIIVKKYCSIEEPFSANQMYVPIARGKLIKSKKYNKWIETNIPILQEKLLPPEKFPIKVDILIMADYIWKSKHDTDNIIKPLIDLLVKAKIIPNDTTKYINGVNVRYLQGFGKPVTTISYDYED